MVLLIVYTGVGPDWYMTGSRVDDFCTVFGPFWYIMKKGFELYLHDRQTVCLILTHKNSTTTGAIIAMLFVFD